MLPHIAEPDVNDYEEKYGILIFDEATCIQICIQTQIDEEYMSIKEHMILKQQMGIVCLYPTSKAK